MTGRMRYNNNKIRKAISKYRKKTNKRKSREPKDFEGQEAAKVACVGLESDDEEDDGSVELEEFDMIFPTRKKSKAELAMEAMDNI